MGAANSSWPKWGGDLSNQSLQITKGAITTPVIKWKFPASPSTDDGFEWQFSAVADCDGDGHTEVVVLDVSGVLYCLRGSDGAAKWSFPTGGMFSSPAIADCDGDGQMEVVAGGNNLYCLRGSDGGIKWSFTEGTRVFFSSPAIADCDGDGQMEVVVGQGDAGLYCLSGSSGSVEWTGPLNDGASAIADLEGDGQMEVVYGGGERIYCLRGSDGTQKWFYWFMGSPGISSSPAIADCDGDGIMEVIMGGPSKVKCLGGADGVEKWSFNPPGKAHTPGVLVDVDGDNRLEFLVPQIPDDTLYCLNAEDGSPLWKIKLGVDVHSPFAGDIDDDGCVEIMVGVLDSFLYAIDDPGNATNCGLLDMGESSHEDRIDFRAFGRGLYLFLPEQTEISLGIYDASGRLIQNLYAGLLSPGGHTFTPNTPIRGVYVAVMRYRGGLKTVRFVR